MLDTPCTLYSGHLDKDGYGKVYYPPHKVQRAAHRVKYAEHKGVELDALRDVVLRHTCDTPACINPHHLVEGTQADNMHDMILRKRLGRRAGEYNNKATLTDEQVKQVKAEYTGRRGELTALGKKYKTSRVTIANIVRGYTRCGT